MVAKFTYGAGGVLGCDAMAPGGVGLGGGKKLLAESKASIKSIISACCVAKNDAHQHYGHSPNEWALGKRPRKAADVLAAEEPLASISLCDEDERFAEKLDTQVRARLAFEMCRSREMISKALRQSRRLVEAH